MRNTKTIPICKEETRRENGADSDRRGRAIVTADSYTDLAKVCVVDRGWADCEFDEEEEEEGDTIRDVY